jgi:hypothetical protein
MKHVTNQSLVGAQIGAEFGSNECQWKREKYLYVSNMVWAVAEESS